MRFSILLAFTAAVAFVSFGAEAQSSNSTNSTALPSFTYNLRDMPLPERQNLCDRNMGYCVNNCGGASNTPKNFCNVTTMGWGCGCKDKIPDYQGYQWPINYAACTGSGLACESACQGNDKQSCIVACTSAYGSVCGTPKQPPAYYEVSDPSVTPTYGPPTNSSNGNSTTTSGTNPSGTSNSNSTSGSPTPKSNDANVLSHSILCPLAIVAAGMMML